MHRIKICVVTGSRAEFGYLLPLLHRLNEDAFFELKLVVTGAHLSERHGFTVKEIEDSGIPIDAKIPVLGIENNSREGIALQIGEIIKSFTSYFSTNRPDLLIAIADRYEIFSVGIAASTLLIPICHISGGSTTSGAIDEIYRHSLTKMSEIHFPTCEEYRKRVIQLGENPNHVYNAGSLAIENCLKTNLYSRIDLLNELIMDINKPYCVVTYHPVTLELGESEDSVYELIHAFDMNPQYQYLITLSNADSGGDNINNIWITESKKRKNFYVFQSLGMKRYLTALKYAKMMIGNSSSGTTEGPAMRIPVINIGDRQKGRVFPSCALHCQAQRDEIDACIKKAQSEEYLEFVKKTDNPFGDGDTSRKMIEILKKEINNGINIKKNFFDIDYKV